MIIVTQVIFFSSYFLLFVLYVLYVLYLLWPKIANPVAAIWRKAQSAVTPIILPVNLTNTYAKVRVPPIAIDYWKLGPESILHDVSHEFAYALA